MGRILTSAAVVGLLITAAFAAVSLSVLATSEELFDTDEAPAENEEVTWTIMAYIAGDNNLEFEAVSDVMEMEVHGSQNGVNVIALVDTHTLFEGTHWYYIGEGETHFDLEANETYCDCEQILGSECEAEEQNMGDPATLQNFIEVSVAYAPADRYMLVLWDHGGGWYGVCWDDSSIREEDNRTDRLTVHEVATAIEAAEDSTGIHLDVIGFDACLMAMVEVAYECRDLADYMVASVTGIPFDGWAYDLFLDDLVANPSMSVTELCNHIVDGYVEYYSFCEGSGLGGWTGVTLSVLDLSVAEELAGAVDALSYEIAEGLSSGDVYRGGLISSFQANTPALEMYGQQFAFVDLGYLADNLAESFDCLTEEAQAVADLVDDMVVRCDWVSQVYGGAFGTTGLTIYLPCAYFYTYVDYSYETEEEAAAAGELIYYGLDFVIETNWDEFILDFCIAYVPEEA
ncbi:MAG: hypothetical protein JSV90_02130 [Methanobacteriota archaeon]|nr:MAG: hypothetical protein JSV90_02130 [Euryarchaeota archaeon]